MGEIPTPADQKKLECRACKARSAWTQGYVHVSSVIHGPHELCVTCYQYYRTFIWFYWVTAAWLLAIGWIGYLVTHSFAAIPEFVAAFLLLAYLAVALHEVGHALAARIVGVEVAVLSFGGGQRVKVVKRGDMFLIFGLLPTEGYVVPRHRSSEHYRKRQAVVLVSGAVANLLGAVVAATALAVFRGHVSRDAAVATLSWAGMNLIGMLNLLPFTVQGPFGKRYSDGKQLWRLLRLADGKVKEIIAATMLRIANLELRFGSSERALSLIAGRFGSERGSAQFDILAVALLVNAGRWAEAVDLARARLRSESLTVLERGVLQNNLAFALLEGSESKDLEEAEALSGAAFEALPMVLAVRSTRGAALVRRGEYRAAIELLSDRRFRLESRPNRATVKAALAVALAGIGDHSGAGRALADARSLDPENRHIRRAAEELATAGGALRQPAPDASR